MNKFDYIIVGAGSAGCVLARRLVDAGKQVLLLEAGGSDRALFVQMPATFVRVLGTKRTWLYQTDPQVKLNKRCMFVPQGRTLGGGSSVNAMIYIRGNSADYDHWASNGCEGWDYKSVLPYFIKSEENQLFSNQFHGNDGLLKVNHTRSRHPLSKAFIKAAQEIGIPYNHDFNGKDQSGVGFYQTTTFNGERGSTSTTYLKDILASPCLKLITNVLVNKLLLKENTQDVIGVQYRDDKGVITEAFATAEVILSAGALATPKILMLSGIGDPSDIEKVGLKLEHALVGVGKNFQDHLEVAVYGRTKKPISLMGNDKGLKALKHGAQWLTTRTGLLTSNVVESGGFIDSTAVLAGKPLTEHAQADIQFHVLPTLVGDIDRAPIAGHGISINPCFLRPKSRGSLSLNSADPQDPIHFKGGFLEDDSDLDVLVRGVKLARKILRAPALTKHIQTELGPFEGTSLQENDLLSDEQIKEWIRAKAKTVYHPSGTCKMGIDDQAVVDHKLKVHGLNGLRIADASIMPFLVSGNTNAAVIMIAERCADFILSETTHAETTLASTEVI